VTDRTVLDDFIRELNGEFPNFKIVEKKNSRFSKAIALALKIITFGGQSAYMSRYYTVIGDTLYVPEGWDEVDPVDAVITLRHERIHLRQRRRYTMVGMTLIYLLFPVPLGLAYGRARIEWEAYTETLRATLELRGRDAVLRGALRDRILTQFTSAAYGWMWPFRSQLNRWYDAALVEIGATGSSD
jgi:hypothetical protein